MKAVHRYAKLTAFLGFSLICAGALVTSTGASLSVPGWPLAFGKLIPPLTGGVVFEYGHRVIAGVVLILTVILAGIMLRRDPRRWARNLALLAVAGIVLQALLGGLTVLLRLPPPISIAHACLGQTVFCLLVAVAQATSPWFMEETPISEKPGVRKLGLALVGLIFLQILWGAIIRHMGRAIVLHMAWALLILIAAIVVLVKSYRPAKRAALSRPALLLIHLVPLQIVLGFIALKIRFSPDIPVGFGAAAALTAAHVAVGALIFATATLWTMRAYKLS